MKQTQLLPLVLIIGTTLARADSISFSEKWTDSVAPANDGTHYRASKNSGTVKAVFTVPGLQSMSSDDFGGAAVTLSFGNIDFEDVLDNANSFSPTKAVFNLTGDNGLGGVDTLGQVTFSRSNNTLTVSLVTSSPQLPILADWYFGANGVIRDTVAFSLAFGDFQVDRRVYLTGKGVVTEKSIVTGDNQEQFFLGSIQISGSADFAAPKVKLLSPSSGARLTKETIAVQVRATDNIAVREVDFQVNDGAPQSGDAQDGDVWSADLDFAPGTNVVQIVAFDSDGNASLLLTADYVYVVVKPLDLEIDGSGKVSGVTNGQPLQVGKTYTVTAVPAPGWIFAGWNGNPDVIQPQFSFQMQDGFILQATFIPNPFVPAKGTYSGLFYEESQVNHESSGFFTAVLTDKGAFSAKMQVGGQTYPFTGHFSLEGEASNSVARVGLAPLSVTLELDPDLAGVITGTIRDGAWTSYLRANQSVYSKTHPAPQVGKYTLVFPGQVASPAEPGGDGIGTVTVDASGNANLIGSMADGTKITQSAPLSINGDWPLFVSLYSGQGSLLCWLSVTNQPDADITGTACWIKKPQANSKLYPSGFTNETDAIGSLYQFTNKVPVLNLTSGQISFENGDLALNFTNRIALGTNNKFTNKGTNKLTLTLTTASGLFQGTVVNPVGGKSIPFTGVVFQKGSSGNGYFLGTNQSGRVLIN